MGRDTYLDTLVISPRGFERVKTQKKPEISGKIGHKKKNR